jgi:SnoaL-like domain
MDTAALVARMVEGFNRHDPEALAACYAPDARVHPAGWPEAVDAGTWLAAFPVILATFPDLQLHPHNLAADHRWRCWRPG